MADQGELGVGIAQQIHFEAHRVLDDVEIRCSSFVNLVFESPGQNGCSAERHESTEHELSGALLEIGLVGANFFAGEGHSENATGVDRVHILAVLKQFEPELALAWKS